MPRLPALAVVLLAAAPAAAQTPRERGDLAIRARDILKRHCGECHGAAPARGDLSVLDHPKLTAGGHPIPLMNRDAPAKSLLLDLIRDGSMPPGGRTGPTAAELEALEAWAKAGAPGYPRAFDDAYAREAARADAATRPADRPFLRYLSFAHLVAEGPGADLLGAEAKLRSALQSASGKKLAAEPIDPPATVFRLDLRAAGWAAGDLFDRKGMGIKGKDAHPLTAFDVVLLEYPFPPGPADPALAGVRKVPVVRGDWLADALSGTPLGADVRALTDLAAEPDRCGPRPGRFFATRAAARPLDAWHTADPDSGAFKFSADIVTAAATDTPVTDVKVGERYSLRVTTEQPVSLRVVGVLSDGSLRLLATDKTQVGAGTHRVKSLVSSSLVRGMAEETEFLVVFASKAEIPVPTLLKSRHLDADCRDKDQYPIWRFVFEPDANFDPAAVVRRVVPVTVRKAD